MRHVRLAFVSLLVAALALVAMPTAAHAHESGHKDGNRIVRIWHAATTPTSVLGTGLGTVRTWFTPIAVDGTSAPGQYMTGTLTTVAIDAARSTEWRTANLVFVIGAEANQLVIGGVSTYPSTSATIAVGTTTTRPIIGGSGTYAGAHGYVVTTNLGASGWLHTFHLLH
jgi:hypothetical protein